MNNEQGIKDDLKKMKASFMPPSLYLHKLDVYAYGAAKYGQDNWRKGFDYSRLYDAAVRHMVAFWSGENVDRESKMHHLLHAAWNLDTLWYMNMFDLGKDDRKPDPGKKQLEFDFEPEKNTVFAERWER